MYFVFVLGVRWKTVYESAVVRTRLTLSQNKHVAVIGGYGSFAATRAAAMRLDKYQVVLASPYGATINRNDHTALNTCLDRANNTHSQNICEVDTIIKLFICYDVNEVNFFYNDDDFIPFHSSRQIGATLRCYIAVLQAIIGKNIAIKLYLQEMRNKPHVMWQNTHNRDMMKDFKIVQYGSQKQQSDNEQLEIKLHDVFFHSLRSYLEMYRKLYNLQVTVFVN